MPIYDYRCNSCSNEFECLQLSTTTVPAACPSCAGEDLERLPAGFAVSSNDIRRARVQKARELRRNSSNYKDEKMAEGEHIREHVREREDHAQNTKS